MRPVLLLVLLALAGCGIAPSSLPSSPHMVVVKAVRLPDRRLWPWFTRFADHTWVDVRLHGRWRRVEVRGSPGVLTLQPDEGLADARWDRQVRVVAWFAGPEAKAIGERIIAIVPEYPYGDYFPWPGPNSNTFVEWLSREVDGFALELPTTAVGRDYATILRAGPTTTRTGLELETFLFGVQLGLREGVELHFLGLVAGVGLWPPTIKLPFLPALPFDGGRRGSAAR